MKHCRSNPDWGQKYLDECSREIRTAIYPQIYKFRKSAFYEVIKKIRQRPTGHIYIYIYDL
jgi:hypothetical protein